MSVRKPTYPIEQLLLDRWSPRAMSGEAVKPEEFMRLLEAARWAPSSYNNQPWRFLYAYRDTPAWRRFFDLLLPFNQEWCKNAGVLVVTVSKNMFEYNDKPSRTHSFDTGSAWENAALQGWAMGLVVHGMEGFDYEKTQKELHIPAGYTVEMMFAVGRPGKKEDLPKELQEREFPSDRKPVQEFAFEGSWRTVKNG